MSHKCLHTFSTLQIYHFRSLVTRYSQNERFILRKTKGIDLIGVTRNDGLDQYARFILRKTKGIDLIGVTRNDGLDQYARLHIVNVDGIIFVYKDSLVVS
jgi:hypothetical protein